jgi:hypothetical protein
VGPKPPVQRSKFVCPHPVALGVVGRVINANIYILLKMGMNNSYTLKFTDLSLQKSILTCKHMEKNQ